MSIREFRKSVRDLKRTLQQARRKRQEGRPRKERRKQARELLLPVDRRCPLCGCLKLNSRQWVCNKHKSYAAVCKSCFMKGEK